MEHSHQKMWTSSTNARELHGGIGSPSNFTIFNTKSPFETPSSSAIDTQQTIQPANNFTQHSQPPFDPEGLDAWLMAEIERLTQDSLLGQLSTPDLSESCNPLCFANASMASTPWQPGNSPTSSMPMDWITPQPMALSSSYVNNSPSSLAISESDNTPLNNYATAPGSCGLGCSPPRITPEPVLSRTPARADSPTQLSFAREEVHTNVEPKAQQVKCPICPQTSASLRDIDRHLWSRHVEYAILFQAKSEFSVCPKKGCKRTGRRDNLSRHYRAKHGGEIKWRNGIAQIL